LCFDLGVPNEETHALQVPYDITRPQGLVYDLTTFLRVLLSNCETCVMYFALSAYLREIVCCYRVDFSCRYGF
jgi:hypothetical protein